MLKRFAQVLLEMEEYLIYHCQHGHNFAFGFDNPTMPDIFMFPVFERIVCMKETTWQDVYYQLDIENHVPEIIKYVGKLKQVKEFEDVLMNVGAYSKYLDKFKNLEDGKKPSYELEFLD